MSRKIVRRAYAWLSTLLSLPFRNQRRYLPLSLFFLIVGSGAIFCPYLKTEFYALAYEEYVALCIYTWAGLSLHIGFLFRNAPTPRFIAKYRLVQARATMVFGRERLLLSFRALLFTLKVKWAKVAGLCHTFLERRAKQEHKVLPADASRAAKDSARYKSLLKRFK